MKVRLPSARRVLAALTCALGPVAAHASLSVFSSQASFLAAVTGAKVDSFDDMFPGGIPSSPLTRSTASFGYQAVTGPNYPYFLNTATSANRWLAAGDTRDTVTFSSLTGGAQAIGGNFFESQLSGNNTAPVVSSGDVTITVTDSAGAQSVQTITGATPGSFLGFVSTATIVSLSMFDPQKAHMASVDNLSFAAAAAVIPAVPEPDSIALLLAGLSALGVVRHRRRDAPASGSTDR